MRNLLVVFSLIFSGVLIMNSCASSKLVASCATTSNTTITYTSKIKPLIDSYCIGCHGTDAKESIGDFTNYAGLSKYLTNGRFETKVLVKQSMPKGTTLSQAEIDLIQCWKDNGYKE